MAVAKRQKSITKQNSSKKLKSKSILKKKNLIVKKNNSVSDKVKRKIAKKHSKNSNDTDNSEMPVRINGECNYCSFVATDAKLVANHIREDHDASASCKDCQKSFKNPRQLKFHTKSIHQVKNKEIFNYRVPSYLKPWVAKANPEERPLVFTCVTCHDKFGSSVILAQHNRQVHHVAKPYNFCKQGFVKSDNSFKPICAKKLFRMTEDIKNV